MVDVILDESQFGKPQRDADQPEWCFFQVTKGEKEFITKRRGDGTTLVAVTKAQFKAWKAWKIDAVPALQ